MAARDSRPRPCCNAFEAAENEVRVTSMFCPIVEKFDVRKRPHIPPTNIPNKHSPRERYIRNPERAICSPNGVYEKGVEATLASAIRRKH